MNDNQPAHFSKNFLKLSTEPAHRRNIVFDTARVEQGIEVRSELKDVRVIRVGIFPKRILIHHMVVRLTIDPNLVILKAEFSTLKAPYLDCVSYAVSPDLLVGVSLQKGFTKKVLELYGGTVGCSHILTLLMQMASAVRQGYAFSYQMPNEEQRMTPQTIVPIVQRMAKFIEDSCMVWKKDSAVQTDIKKGELRDLPTRLYPRFWKKYKSYFQKR